MLEVIWKKKGRRWWVSTLKKKTNLYQHLQIPLIPMQVLLHTLNSPTFIPPLHKLNPITDTHPSLLKNPIIPPSTALLPGLTREILQAKAMIEFEARLSGQTDLQENITDADDVADADVPLVHVLAHDVLAETAGFEVGGRGVLGAPGRVVAWVVLVDGFVDAAVECGIVLVALEAG